jgi:hypothetical protein
MTILEKIMKILVLTIQGVVAGVFLNLSWHFFLATVTGWGNMAPDWYFNIQGTVFIGIFLFGLVGWVIFSLRLRRNRIPLTGDRKS